MAGIASTRWLITRTVGLITGYMNLQMADPVKKKVWDGRFLKLPLAGTIILIACAVYILRRSQVFLPPDEE